MEKPYAPPPYYNQNDGQTPYPPPQFSCPPPEFHGQPPQMPSPPQTQIYHTPIIMAPAPPTQPSTTVVNVNTQHQGTGTCPVCHAGTFRTGFTCCGWCCGIFLFPIGTILCLCCMREKRCNHCGFSLS